jgi:hypothetical protein
MLCLPLPLPLLLLLLLCRVLQCRAVAGQLGQYRRC